MPIERVLCSREGCGRPGLFSPVMVFHRGPTQRPIRAGSSGIALCIGCATWATKRRPEEVFGSEVVSHVATTMAYRLGLDPLDGKRGRVEVTPYRAPKQGPAVEPPSPNRVAEGEPDSNDLMIARRKRAEEIAELQRQGLALASGSFDYHPMECGGAAAACPHCLATRSESHDPDSCGLCQGDDS